MKIVIEENIDFAGKYRYTYNNKRYKKETVFTDLQIVSLPILASAERLTGASFL